MDDIIFHVFSLRLRFFHAIAFCTQMGHFDEDKCFKRALDCEPLKMKADMVNAFFPSGHDTCVEVLLEQEVFHKAEGSSFSPLHCAV